MLWGVSPYLWLILIIFIIVTAIVIKKALDASRKRRERLKKEAAIWKRDYELREKYRELTENKILNAPDDELLHGVAMNIQIKLENADSMEKAFEVLPTEKKYVYTLEYFDEDAKQSLSFFFKNNGEPLTGLSYKALEEIGLFDISQIVKELYPMYDPDSEVSVDREIIGRKDVEFKEKYSSKTLLSEAAKYIIGNKEIFLN